MAEDLEPIRQVVNIDVKESGASEATSDMDKLDVSIKDTTKSVQDNTKENKKSEEGFKSLKVQLKEAIATQQKLSQQYGATSSEATKAAKAVAGIKDEIGFQKDLVDSYNPDEKFRGLTQTAGLAALALGGVKDGLAAVGIESKGLDQVIGSAQALLGVTSAVAGVTDAYEVLTAAKKAKSAADVVEIGTTEALAVAEGEAAVATWSWNAALLANPIVLITAAIVAAGAAIYAYVKITGDAATAEEKAIVASMQLTRAIDIQAKSFENNSKFLQGLNNHKIALLKASGASEKQIYAETEALKAQEIQLAQNNRNELIRLEQRAYELDKANSTDATKAALKLAKESLQAANDLILKGFNEQDKLRDDHEVAVRQAETDAREKAAQKQAEADAKALQAQKDANQKRLDEEYAFRLKMIELADENETKDIENKIANIQRQSDEIGAAEEEAANKELAREKDIAEKRKAQKQAETDSLNALGNSALNAAKDLFGKNKNVQKGIIATEGAVALGKVGVNTVQAVSADNAASPLTFGLPWSAVHIATGALGAASIIANTKKALSAVGGGNSPSASGGNGAATPSRNVAQVGFQASSENQIATSIKQQQKDQPPIQAFVVSQAVTDQQEIDRKKELNNSF